jgi:hypothetical protein
LFTQLEQASTKLMHALQQGSAATDTTEPLAKAQADGSLLCIRKHQRNGSGATGPLSQDDVLRMLVHESRHSRALAVHLCPGASAFHVFSRRGWSRFRPLDGAAVVTVGDQLQVIECTLAPTSSIILTENSELYIMTHARFLPVSFSLPVGAGTEPRALQGRVREAGLQQ